MSFSQKIKHITNCIYSARYCEIVEQYMDIAKLFTQRTREIEREELRSLLGYETLNGQVNGTHAPEYAHALEILSERFDGKSDEAGKLTIEQERRLQIESRINSI